MIVFARSFVRFKPLSVTDGLCMDICSFSPCVFDCFGFNIVNLKVSQLVFRSVVVSTECGRLLFFPYTYVTVCPLMTAGIGSGS